jgi:hypothetical protein
MLQAIQLQSLPLVQEHASSAVHAYGWGELGLLLWPLDSCVLPVTCALSIHSDAGVHVVYIEEQWQLPFTGSG